MVLVLGISVVGIAAIMYWGLPAIDEMKANVEHRSLEAQFHELDATIKELIAGTTERTAKRWHPTMNRGQISMVNETEGWVYATEMWSGTADHSFVYLGFEDGDNRFQIKSIGSTALTNAKVEAFRLNGTTTGHSLTVTTAVVGAWAVGDTKTFDLHDQALVANLRNATIRIRVFEGSTQIAEAFYVPTGRLDYELTAGLGTRTLSENNGAIISGTGGSTVIVNSPPAPPVVTTNGVPRFFGRAVFMNASASFAGDDRFDLLVTLHSTSTLANHDCALAAAAQKTDCVESAKIFIYGTHQATWRSYLLNAAKGYTYTEQTEGSLKYLEHRAPHMGYTLLQSVVGVRGA